MSWRGTARHSSSSRSTLHETHIPRPSGPRCRRPKSRDDGVRFGPRPGKQGCNTEDAKATGAHETGKPGASRGVGTNARANLRKIFLLRVLRWPSRPPCYSLTDLRAEPRARHPVLVSFKMCACDRARPEDQPPQNSYQDWRATSSRQLALRSRPSMANSRFRFTSGTHWHRNHPAAGWLA